MSQAEPRMLTCPGCGTRYRWRDAFAGKVLDCKCGASFRADDAAQPQAQSQAVAATAPATEQGVGAKREAGESSRAGVAVVLAGMRSVALPLIVIALGWSVSVVLWQRVAETPLALAMIVGAAGVLQVTVFLPAMLGTMVLLAGWFDLGLGTLGSVLTKCVALTLGPAAAVDALFTWMMAVADFDWWLLAAGYAYYLIISGIPAAIAFGLNVHETALATAMIFVSRVVAVYLAALVFPQAFVGVLG